MRKPRRFPFFASSLVAVLGLAVAPAIRSAQTPVNAPVVKLLSPGKDPKRPMRMTAKVGLRRTGFMRIKMGIEMAMGEKKVRGILPEISITMDVFRNGAVGFIDWLDVGVAIPFALVELGIYQKCE